MTDILGALLLMLFIGFALFGGLVLVAMLSKPKETERQRIARETREAERQVTEMGRQAQATILAEALRRAQQGPTAQRGCIDDSWLAGRRRMSEELRRGNGDFQDLSAAGPGRDSVYLTRPSRHIGLPTTDYEGEAA